MTDHPRSPDRILRALFGPPWRRVDSRGRGTLDRARKALADRLEHAARRLDPGRPTVTRGPGGSHTVMLGGTPLARVEPGHIRDTRW